MTKQIRFLTQHGKNGWLSNFSDHFVIQPLGEKEHIQFPTAEHFYQAYKFKQGSFDWSAILTAPTPEKAREIGHQNPNIMPGFDTIKMRVMELAINSKFITHMDLLEKLYETGDAILLKDSKDDGFWGVGANDKGENHLGKLLMDFRSKINLRNGKFFLGNAEIQRF